MSEEKQITHVALPVELFRALRASLNNATFPSQTFGQVSSMLTQIDQSAKGVNIQEDPPAERSEAQNPPTDKEAPKTNRGSKK